MSGLPDFAEFSAPGEVQDGGAVVACEAAVDSSGLTITRADGVTITWPAHEIVMVSRDGHELTVTRAGGASLLLRRFARRTDELQMALRRARADAFARLMAPPGKSALEITEAFGATPGFLYRHDDGLRWVPDAGECRARLYDELDAVRFDPAQYILTLSGPFGVNQVSGLRRITREVEAEGARRITRAREVFAEGLAAVGLPWEKEVAAGRIRRHVPVAPSPEQLAQVEATEGLICAERAPYWITLRGAGVIARLVISAGPEGGLRLVALCPLVSGELYEVLSEADHAGFVFACADDAVRAWTEVGFRREPIFAEEGAGEYRALAEVLPSLRTARGSLRRRVLHDEPAAWWARLRWPGEA